jgi:hypothetical protein
VLTLSAIVLAIIGSCSRAVVLTLAANERSGPVHTGIASALMRSADLTPSCAQVFTSQPMNSRRWRDTPSNSKVVVMVADLLHLRPAQVVTELRVSDQQHRQDHAIARGHFHQPLEAGQCLMVQLMGLVDDQHDRMLVLADEIAEFALAPFGLLGDLHLGGQSATVPWTEDARSGRGESRLTDQTARLSLPWSLTAGAARDAFLLRLADAFSLRR